LGVPEHHLALLCFGLIRPYKGVEVLLEAVASLPGDLPVTLLLAGEPWGEAGERLRARIAAPDLAGRVVARLEWVPEGEAPAWFAAADVAVLPYRSATGSAVAAQALGAGLPVVGSRVGGIAEVVEDGASGFLVPPDNVPALAVALARLVEPGLVARLAGGARAAAARWSWSSYADTLDELATAVLGNARAGSDRS
jgi:glycosyltransferase involved in cell wall biosynthesis